MHSLLKPNRAPLAKPPKAQLPGSSFSLKAAEVHVVSANRPAAPPSKRHKNFSGLISL